MFANCGQARIIKAHYHTGKRVIMSVQLIYIYHNEVANLRRVAKSLNETSLRPPFQKLLEAYALRRKLTLVAELSRKTKTGHTIRPDGTLKDQFSDWGYWESKDEQDDLDHEIASKFAKGYPSNNILFEDTKTAVLYQAGEKVGQVNIYDAEELDQLLTRWVSYETPEVKHFREALDNFTRDVPALVEALREAIDQQTQTNTSFQRASQTFLELCQKAINPSVEMADVREMIIQHILTQDIFTTIFDNSAYHQENTIAQTLGLLVRTFYSGATRQKIDAKMRPYYEVISARAHQIADHHEKQKFLKVIYENFYKVYNPKAADRLGIVYTPNEIVRFMIESADYLCHKHFGKGLGSKGVDILDPATGTGTFITELIDYLPPHQLTHKYQEEIFANEVSILPYYIANLNIEYTYQQKMGEYLPFENICFVDTLDNLGFEFEGKQHGLFALEVENEKRIKRQNGRKISVIIGNPPYNAWQENFNMQNANRPYKYVDGRIKETYVKQGKAQNQIAVYDMYVRFYRWATDRLNSTGIVAFITNSSFVDSFSFMGFRKCIQDDFDYVYVIDLGGNIRTLSGKDGIFLNEAHTIFGVSAAVGIAMMFLVRTKPKNHSAQIAYIHPCDIRATRDEKLAYLQSHPFDKINFEVIQPDKNYYWINQAENNWDVFLPIADKETKAGKGSGAIFRLFSRGVATQRDEWVYDFSSEKLAEKMKFFVKIYQTTLGNPNNPEKMQIKWDRELTKYLERRIQKEFNQKSIVPALYRPFSKVFLYFDKHFNGMTYQWFDIYRSHQPSPIIAFNAGSTEFMVSSFDHVILQNSMLVSGGSTQCVPFIYYDDLNNPVDNITDWALKQFQDNYQDQSIGKEAIFHYVYAVLHHPAYRQKYEINLKREFPRIPFYANFWQWAEWGKQLMELHINYEEVEPYPLGREEKDPEQTRQAYKAKLKADRAAGVIELDTLTTLTGIPAGAWEYKLGNRSALEWVCDRYKEKTPSDPTIAEKFNSYRFADYKEQVIELLGRVTAVSVQTIAILGQMPKETV